MRVDVHASSRSSALLARSCLVALVVACRQSSPVSDGAPAAPGTGAAGQPGAGATATAQPSAAPWPVTCDAAAARAIEKLGPAGVQRLRSLSKDELIILHDTLGLNIRNGFGLWGGNDALLDSCSREAGGTRDPDAVSMVIITRAWERVNDERKASDGGQ